MPLRPEPVEHRQTGYVPSPILDPPDALPLPPLTRDFDVAKEHLSEYGMCFVPDVLTTAEIDRLRTALDEQAAAERSLGELAPPGALGNKQHVANMVNKGRVFLDLVERPETDELAGFMLGRTFLVSSMTGGMFHAPTTEPQPLHRDQGYVPAMATFPAACNLFWLLDDFTPASGSTHVVPGSHRWRPEYQIKAPPREMSVQVEVPAGSVFAWEGASGTDSASTPTAGLGAASRPTSACRGCASRRTGACRACRRCSMKRARNCAPRWACGPTAR